jgi:hypothetical protein
VEGRYFSCASVSVISKQRPDETFAHRESADYFFTPAFRKADACLAPNHRSHKTKVSSRTRCSIVTLLHAIVADGRCAYFRRLQPVAKSCKCRHCCGGQVRHFDHYGHGDERLHRLSKCHRGVSPVPANDPPTCLVNPSSVMLSATTTTATSTLRISTTAGLSGGFRPPSSPNKPDYFAASLGLALSCILLLRAPKQRRRWAAASLGLIVLASLGVTLSSCAGGGGSNQINFGTPSGGYTVTVAASGGGTTQTTSVLLNVQ